MDTAHGARQDPERFSLQRAIRPVRDGPGKAVFLFPGLKAAEALGICP